MSGTFMGLSGIFAGNLTLFTDQPIVILEHGSFISTRFFLE